MRTVGFVVTFILRGFSRDGDDRRPDVKEGTRPGVVAAEMPNRVEFCCCRFPSGCGHWCISGILMGRFVYPCLLGQIVVFFLCAASALVCLFAEMVTFFCGLCVLL